MAVFDLTFGYGKKKLTQTIVAVRHSEALFWSRRFDPSLTIENIDDWALAYRLKELMPVAEIEELLLKL